MAKKKPRWLGVNSDGRDGSWKLVRKRKPKPFSLTRAITRITTWFRVDGKRWRSVERKRGRRPMARVHPNRYRRREYRR